MPRKILILIGTRPELVKLAPVIRAISSRPDQLSQLVCFTSQHRELLSQAAQDFEITANFDLDLMQPGQSLGGFTSRAISAIDLLVDQVRPELVLVQGDTSTAFCGALAAFYHQVSVAHVEAGLRTENKYSPFPEELNRRLITCLADYHFAPTPRARDSLLRENIPDEHIFVTGNTVIDSLQWMKAKLASYQPTLPDGLMEMLNSRRLILSTGHRRESFGVGLVNICAAIRNVAEQREDVMFIYPVHPNPNVSDVVRKELGGLANVWLMNPLPYRDFVWLMDRSYIILTDSGGVQEEAPALGKPVLVTREVTERLEGVEAGAARLVGTNQMTIETSILELLDERAVYQSMAQAPNPYGNGQAGEKIARILAQGGAWHSAGPKSGQSDR